MKRVVYIVLLSAATVLVITLIDLFFSGDEQDSGAPRDQVPEIPELEMPAVNPDEAGLWNLKYPLYENVRNDAGQEVRVQTALFLIENVRRKEGNEFEARNITFEFYDKNLFDRPPKDRVLAKGRADRAKLFSKSADQFSGMDLEFRSEFVLEDNVVIDTFDSRTGAPSFTMESKNLIFKDERFDSTGEVVLHKEGIVITGEELHCDIRASTFTLKRNVRVEGSGAELAGLAELGAPRAAPPPAAGEAKPQPSSPILITAAGALDLSLSGASRSRPGAFAVVREGNELPLNQLKLNDDVHVQREGMDLRCDRLYLDFYQSEEGGFDIRTFRGLSENQGTRLQLESYAVRCDEVDFEREGDSRTLLFVGRPEVDNVAFPMFSSLQAGQKRRDPASPPELLDIRCKDRIRIAFTEPPPGEPDRYDVRMNESVVIRRRLVPDPPLLRADTLSFQAEVPPRSSAPKEQAPKEPEEAAGGPVRGEAAPTPGENVVLRDFVAGGGVQGAIEPFAFTCNELGYGIVEMEEGRISELSLRDETRSTVSTKDFSLEAPEIHISLRPEITEITSEKVFRCVAGLEKLPAMTSFNLFPGGSDSPAETEAAADPEAPPAAAPGSIDLAGQGDFRLMLRDEAGSAVQNILISDSPGFTLDLRRGPVQVLSIHGEHSFSLTTADGELSRLHLDEGGRIDCEELGFFTSGESLHLEHPSPDVLEFLTQGSAGDAFVSFSRPGRLDTCDVHAKSIRIRTGTRTELLAEGEVRADLPMSLFQDRKEAARSAAAPLLSPEQAEGTYHVRSDTLVLERPEKAERFKLTCDGSTHIRSEETGLDARCDTCTYDGGNGLMTLWGVGRQSTEILMPSRPGSDHMDRILTERAEIDMPRSRASLQRGGDVHLGTFDDKGRLSGSLDIHCEREINLVETVLLFRGPVALKYSDAEGNEGRSLDCDQLYVFFKESPLTSRFHPMDLESYEAMVRDAPGSGNGSAGQEGNLVTRMKAQDHVVFLYDDYRVTCTTLNWNLLTDEILCEGGDEKVTLSLKDQAAITGAQVLLRPVNEEFIVLRR